MVFTGIVQAIGDCYSKDHRLHIVSPNFFVGSKLGDSISVNGVCLTLESVNPDEGIFFVMEETQKLTNLHQNNKVNLELALSYGCKIDGHLISGHVDNVAQITKIITNEDRSIDVWIDLTKFDRSFITHKGSISLDGVSLTIAEVSFGRKVLCRVSLILYTTENTIFKYRKEGDYLNVELNRSNLTTQSDEDYMKKAIKQSHKGRYTAPPNPWVGCVLVDNYGQIIGKGYHRCPGEPHAEVNAVNDAIKKGFSVKNSVAYVTLEPCHHTGRTGPCDEFLIKHQIAKVVVGIEDPDLRVRGKGIQRLKDVGIDVVVGVCSDLITNSLKPYIHQRLYGKPYIIAKSATSIDGYIGYQNNEPFWITNEKSRYDGHLVRAESQAIIIGSKTAKIDNPYLNIRGIKQPVKEPLRVVLDSHGIVTEGHLMDQTIGPTLIFCGHNTSIKTTNIWDQFGVEYCKVDLDDGKINLLSVVHELNQRGIMQILIEGGGIVIGEFIRKGLVDKLVVYQGPVLIGSTGVSMSGLYGDYTQKWKLLQVEKFDDDIKVVYEKVISI